MNEQLKSSIKLIAPPVLTNLVNRVRAQAKERDEETLFEGNDQLFKRILASTVNYAEYGCGKSTVWVAKHTTATIRSVDSSREWIDIVYQRIGERKADIQWVDCGVLGDWGMPLTFANRDNFKLYAQSAWVGDTEPDTVLIDGRFRVCCFLTSLKYAREGVRLIFDDYTNRPEYHVVEEFVPRHETCGRQCLFIVPKKQRIHSAALERMIEKFEYVMA